MENIRRALRRAKQLNPGLAGQNDHDTPLVPGMKFDANFGRDPAYKRGQERDHDRAQQIELDAGHLESNRIVAHDDTDYRSKAFDMLRTQVLQTMDRKNWKILGITSPSPGCGKTLTSINLALSIARQPEQSVMLVELDLQKPQIANYLGIKCRTGIVSVLDGRSSLASGMVQALAGSSRVTVLPAETSKSDSSAWMTSRAMSTVLQDLKRNYPAHIVVVDLPPMLTSDDVIAVLPQLDCVLLVAAVGRSTATEIGECNRHLQSADVVRLVLNKVPNLNAHYYS
jgi:protein-tyrosine kinase